MSKANGLMGCHTDKCERPPAYRFTWPGRDEAAFCDPCKVWAECIASAMGLYVQFVSLDAGAGLTDDELADKLLALPTLPRVMALHACTVEAILECRCALVEVDENMRTVGFRTDHREMGEVRALLEERMPLGYTVIVEAGF